MQAFVITLREGLEAFLIVALTLTYLRKRGLVALGAAVRWGIVAGVMVSIFGGVILYGARNQERLEGPLALVAAGSVAFLTVQMWRAGRHMKDEIEARLEASVSSTRVGARAGVFLFTLFMIAREGMETVLLLVQLRGLMPLLAGACLGSAAAAAVGWGWTRYGRRVPLALFFQMTALFLFVFLVQLSIQAVHEMAEQGMLPASALIHERTEAWGPDSAFGHVLSYLLAGLPLMWLAVSRLRQTRRAHGQTASVPPPAVQGRL
ncbi:MAG TPA: FTR1 family protein [Vicinamibacterales bacterium]